MPEFASSKYFWSEKASNWHQQQVDGVIIRDGNMENQYSGLKSEDLGKHIDKVKKKHKFVLKTLHLLIYWFDNSKSFIIRSNKFTALMQ